MIDVVETMRDLASIRGYTACADAADEIERLRGLLTSAIRSLRFDDEPRQDDVANWLEQQITPKNADAATRGTK